ncbi:MAG: RecQ family ATP-dependent DNA helicase [Bacteroidia bacterium]|nr:RecQ family ATP-dependent DNA helicase [Bacteroidia bacterium]
MEAARAVLHRYWGYADFRPPQEAVIRAVLEGKEVLAMLPTGGGKSLCYQVSGLVKGGLTLVISPLIALMHDQVSALNRRGIPAAAADSTLPPSMRERLFKEAASGHLKFLYMAPERLLTPALLEKLRALPIQLIAVDEAHCISQWGYDFRSSYLRLGELRSHLPQAQWMALTATATPRVQQDIITYLGMIEPVIVRHSFYRSNFYYAVVYGIDKEARLQQSLRKLRGTGIVYVSSRRASIQLAEKLRQQGFSAAPYHGGMAPSHRTEIQESWLREKTRIIVATSAFGMGIDKPNTRFVLHFDPPTEPEAYFQEIGRAGRDGELAYAIALFAPRDVENLWRRLQDKYPPYLFLLRLYEILRQAQKRDEPLHLSLEELAREIGVGPYALRRALHLLEQEDFLSWREGGPTRAYLRSRVSPQEWQKAHTSSELWIPRLAGASLFTEGVYADLSDWAYQLNIPYAKLYALLEELQARGWLTHDALPESTGEIRLAQPSPSPTQWQALKHKYHTLQRQAQSRGRFMIGYFQQRQVCRAQYLLRYFSEEISPCGQCDICKGYHRSQPITEGEKAAAAAWLCEEAQIPRFAHELKKALHKLFPGKGKELLETFLMEGRLEMLPDWRLRWKQ